MSYANVCVQVSGLKEISRPWPVPLVSSRVPRCAPATCVVCAQHDDPECDQSKGHTNNRSNKKRQNQSCGENTATTSHVHDLHPQVSPTAVQPPLISSSGGDTSNADTSSLTHSLTHPSPSANSRTSGSPSQPREQPRPATQAPVHACDKQTGYVSVWV